MMVAFLFSQLVGCNKPSIQEVNIKKIIEEDLDGRLVPHRVNDLERLRHILNSGLRSFEIDLMFESNESETYFEVGHDKETTNGVHFDLFLEEIKRLEIKKIWLDIKNVREINVDAVVSELNRLDSLFGIKPIVIVEANITSKGFQNISASGFHTSYYLPTATIVSLLEENDPAILQIEADRLKEQLARQSVSAVSFDLRLYPFVKDYLEIRIPDTIVYHTWNSIQIWKPRSVDELGNYEYWMDSRVKTILYKYRSRK